MKKSVLSTLKKTATVFLVCTLILGLLSGSVGVVLVTALGKTPAADATAPGAHPADPQNAQSTNNASFFDPVSEYADAPNEIALNENVQMLTEKESADINNAVVEVTQHHSYYDGNYLTLVLDGKQESFSPTLASSELVYIHGDANTPWGCDRFVKIIDYYQRNDRTYLEVKEPSPEEVFTSMDIAATQKLTADNLVDASFIPGVSAHFVGSGNDIVPLSEKAETTPKNNGLCPPSSEVKAEPLSLHSDAPDVTKTAVDDVGVEFTAQDGDLLVTLDITFEPEDDDDDDDKDDKKDKDHKNDKDDDDDDDEFIDTEVDFGIRGTFGVRNLQSHFICDMPKIGQFEELYFGVSGEQYLNIETYGSFTGTAEPQATEKDFWLFKLEGLNEKRFPIAVFQFQGTTPVYVTNKQFEAQKDSLLPQLYVVLYADWEGEISLELTAGFEYTRGFNNGLRVIKEGKPALSIENHPYPSAYDGKQESFNWHAGLNLTAHTDLTLFGGSLLFYIAGINVGEIGVLRLGLEAEGQVSITLSSDDTQKVFDGEIYLRGYLKLLEIKCRLAITDTIWDGKDIDLNFLFTLLEFELFRLGTQPDEYKPKMPISSMPLPDEFQSAITLVCDVSGSMSGSVSTGESKLEAAKNAAKTIVESTQTWAKNYKENYGIGLVMFSDYATPVALPHIDYKFISDCIDTIEDGGGTCIYSGIDAAIAQMDNVKAANKVIILMTDGQDGATEQAKESAKTAASKNIALYTIGFGNDVDAELLEELAKLGNGEYRFAATDNMIGILQSFMSAQQAANGSILSETSGTVSQGETVEADSFTVENQQGDLMVHTAWPGSFLDTILIDPNGHEVDKNYPDVMIDKSSIPTLIIVKNPIPGEWNTKIVGVETSYDNEPYFTIVSFMETEATPINEPMTTTQAVAAYCMSIGFSSALISLLLLICLRRKKNTV